MSTPAAGGRPTYQRMLSAALDKADAALCAVLTIAMAVMLGAALVQVGARYLTTLTVIGPEEIARYMMVGSTFLAIPVLGRRRNHIAVDALAHYLPGRTRKVWLQRLILALELGFLAVFAVLSWEMFSTSLASGQRSIGLDVPLAWPLATVLVGSAIGALVTLGMFVDSFLESDVVVAAAERDLEEVI